MVAEVIEAARARPGSQQVQGVAVGDEIDAPRGNGQSARIGRQDADAAPSLERRQAPKGPLEEQLAVVDGRNPPEEPVELRLARRHLRR